jgi:uncharacterized protein (UPF0297 family)
MNSDTKLFSVEEVDDALIETTIREVCETLHEVGYNPVNQIVGYLMSGDPGYISSHKNARKKIVKLDRTKVIELLFRRFISK